MVVRPHAWNPLGNGNSSGDHSFLCFPCGTGSTLTSDVQAVMFFQRTLQTWADLREHSANTHPHPRPVHLQGEKLRQSQGKGLWVPHPSSFSS